MLFLHRGMCIATWLRKLSEVKIKMWNRTKPAKPGKCQLAQRLHITSSFPGETLDWTSVIFRITEQPAKGGRRAISQPTHHPVQQTAEFPAQLQSHRNHPSVWTNSSLSLLATAALTSEKIRWPGASIWGVFYLYVCSKCCTSRKGFLIYPTSSWVGQKTTTTKHRWCNINIGLERIIKARKGKECNVAPKTQITISVTGQTNKNIVFVVLRASGVRGPSYTRR